MTLAELAERVVAAENYKNKDWALRIILANFIRGLSQERSRRLGFRDRLRKLRRQAESYPEPIPVDVLAAEMERVLLKTGDRYFLATGRPISCNLNHRAVCIVTHVALREWLGLEKKDIPPNNYELDELREGCAQLSTRIDHGASTLGVPGNAIWLTPDCPPIAHYLGLARNLNRDALVPAHQSSYSDIANSIWELLGLSHYRRRTCLAAVITRAPFHELLHMTPGLPGKCVMGPSVLEGGTHTRWRHWPEDFGRTYMINSGIEDSGLPEAIRRPLPLGEVQDFIYLGAVTSRSAESHESFARVIRVNEDVPGLLRHLHGITKI